MCIRDSINGFSDRLSGIVEINGKQYFNSCKDGKNWETENTADNLTLEEVPAGSVSYTHLLYIR